MYVIVWQFQIIAERRDEFLRRYAADGDWARLFARSPGWRGTDLVAREEASDTFLTIDRWESAEAWTRFRTDFAAEYEQLDLACEGLTRREERLGSGVTL